MTPEEFREICQNLRKFGETTVITAGTGEGQHFASFASTGWGHGRIVVDRAAAATVHHEAIAGQFLASQLSSVARVAAWLCPRGITLVLGQLHSATTLKVNIPLEIATDVAMGYAAIYLGETSATNPG